MGHGEVMNEKEYKDDCDLERLAIEYSEETGSFYFEYSDESNELKDAYKAGYYAANRKFDKLIKIAIAYQRSREGGLAGQAFTGYTCLKCNRDCSHPNTRVPFICPDCVKELKSDN